MRGRGSRWVQQRSPLQNGGLAARRLARAPAACSSCGAYKCRCRRRCLQLTEPPLDHSAGACEADIEHFCFKEDPGLGRLAMCLSQQLAKEAKGNARGAAGVTQGPGGGRGGRLAARGPGDSVGQERCAHHLLARWLLLDLPRPFPARTLHHNHAPGTLPTDACTRPPALPSRRQSVQGLP